MKRCSSCGITKPDSAFYNHNGAYYGGLSASCKHCRDRQNRPANDRYQQRERQKRVAAAGHEMRLRMLGNAAVYVTCSCLEAMRTPARERRAIKAVTGSRAPEWKSLGDFPVGTPVEQLLEAFLVHVEDLP